jgi:hypothetical protein
VTERLKDKSSLVRKGCLQLLGAMLSNNPFAAKVSFAFQISLCLYCVLQLEKEEFRKKLDEEEAILNEVSGDESVKHIAVAQYLQVCVYLLV